MEKGFASIYYLSMILSNIYLFELPVFSSSEEKINMKIKFVHFQKHKLNLLPHSLFTLHMKIHNYTSFKRKIFRFHIS